MAHLVANNASTYEGHDSSRNMQSHQNTGGGYLPYNNPAAHIYGAVGGGPGGFPNSSSTGGEAS